MLLWRFWIGTDIFYCLCDLLFFRVIHSGDALYLLLFCNQSPGACYFVRTLLTCGAPAFCKG